MKKPVQFDVDGVIADFYAGFHSLAARIGVRSPAPGSPWDAYWNEAVWKQIRASWTFWYDLPPLIGEATFYRINMLQRTRPVYFVTNRIGIDPKGQTEAWLIRFGITNPTVVITGRKAEFAQAAGIGYSIEDKAGNAVAISYVSRDITSVIVDRPTTLTNRPHNQFDHTVIGGSVMRMKDVSQFLNFVERSE